MFGPHSLYLATCQLQETASRYPGCLLVSTSPTRRLRSRSHPYDLPLLQFLSHAGKFFLRRQLHFCLNSLPTAKATHTADTIACLPSRPTHVTLRDWNTPPSPFAVLETFSYLCSITHSSTISSLGKWTPQDPHLDVLRWPGLGCMLGLQVQSPTAGSMKSSLPQEGSASHST